MGFRFTSLRSGERSEFDVEKEESVMSKYVEESSGKEIRLENGGRSLFNWWVNQYCQHNMFPNHWQIKSGF
jgi:hypothetical protein